MVDVDQEKCSDINVYQIIAVDVNQLKRAVVDTDQLQNSRMVNVDQLKSAGGRRRLLFSWSTAGSPFHHARYKSDRIKVETQI